MPDKIEKVVEELSKLTVLEASQLSKALEEKWGVTAQAVAAVAAPAASSAEAQEEEKTEFDVYLEKAGDNKLSVIKEVKVITGLALTEAKKFVDSAPKAIKTGVSKEEVQKVKEQLEKVGAEVSVK
ncbi:MAG: 50S ribosomal protein L7/L12 [Alphaproteobacteria bacterium]